MTGSREFTPSSTSIRMKSLNVIYVSCNFYVVELENLGEANDDLAWQKAMKDEITITWKNLTWELVNKPSDKPIIRVKWCTKPNSTWMGLCRR